MADQKTSDAAADNEALISEAFAQRAFVEALKPTEINRFQIIVFDDARRVLAIGGVGIRVNTATGEKVAAANVLAAVTFNKHFAEDLVVNLEAFYEIKEEDKHAAKLRTGLLKS